VLRTFLLITT